MSYRIVPYHTCLGVITAITLAFCVFLQMLGIPGTLLSPNGTIDLMASAVLEGLSIPSEVPEAAASQTYRLFEQSINFLRLPVLMASLFHPPLV